MSTSFKIFQTIKSPFAINNGTSSDVVQIGTTVPTICSSGSLFFQTSNDT